MRKIFTLATTSFLFAILAAPSYASLLPFVTYTGNYGLSTDGGGSLSDTYVVNAFVPFGATVTAAYLYQTTHDGASSISDVTLNGSALSFGAASVNTSANYLASARADVTSIVASIINGGAGGTYGFTVGEANSSSIDGTALAVIYSLATLPESTVALLDGFASLGGDTTTINFADPLNPDAPGFVADLRIGSSFSCCTQASSITINGTTITENAGNNDDGDTLANGALITVGGDNDPFSPLLPSYEDDHERYNLAPYLAVGDTSIKIDTVNPSNNDNIFFAAIRVSGRAGVNEPAPTNPVPEPATWAMMIGGFGLVGASMRRRKVSVSFA
jgi:hypothetical protein